jgi:hypothetical protein
VTFLLLSFSLKNILVDKYKIEYSGGIKYALK